MDLGKKRQRGNVVVAWVLGLTEKEPMQDREKDSCLRRLRDRMPMRNQRMVSGTKCVSPVAQAR